MDTQKKGSFSRWSGDSARWYEAASEYTHYHDKLKTYIAPYLNTEETCCELACGSGTLARCLAPLTARYTANDIDPDSLKFCRARQTERPVPNLEFLPGDWSEVLKDKTFDTVIFSYFSAVFTGWEQLKRLARKKVIAIVPRYSDAEIAEKKKAFAARSRFRELSDRDAAASSDSSSAPSRPEKGRKKGRSFETMEAIARFLDERSVAYRLIPLTMEFGQPCATLQEAEEYVQYYYRFDSEEERKEFVRLKFQPADCGYYFPKKKNIGIVIIDMTSADETERD